MSGVTRIGVVEELLDHASNRRWEALPDLLDEQFVIVEPDSLPYGGTHHGVDGYVSLMQRIGELFELEFEPQGLHDLDDSTVLLRMHVTFTGRETGRTVRLPVLEVLTVRDARVSHSQVFIGDTAALLATLP